MVKTDDDWVIDLYGTYTVTRDISSKKRMLICIKNEGKFRDRRRVCGEYGFFSQRIHI